MKSIAVLLVCLALFSQTVRADESSSGVLEFDDDALCHDLIQNGNETGIDCGGDCDQPCCYGDYDDPDCEQEGGDDEGPDPTNDLDLTESDENTVAGVVLPVSGVVFGSLALGWLFPKCCKTKKQGCYAQYTSALLSVAFIFLLVGSTTDAWNKWAITFPESGHFHYVASPFSLCENAQSGECIYVNQQCNIEKMGGDGLNSFSFPANSSLSASEYPTHNCDRLRVVQAFVVLSCIFGGLTWLASFATGAKPGAKYQISAASALTAACGLITMAVWADYVDSRQGWFAAYDDENQPSEWQYDWSYFCYITGWVSASIAAIVALFITPAAHDYDRAPTKTTV